MHQGSCLCGAIRFTVDGDLPPASACHCTQCRKHTGHHEVGIDVPRSAVTVAGDDKVTWYFSSERVRRGFCSVCGSSMFFDILGVDRIGLNLGSFDGPTNTRIALHIFVANKGDYYDITDGAPSMQRSPAVQGSVSRSANLAPSNAIDFGVVTKRGGSVRSPLKSLVRLLVSLNDRWPIRAAVVWAVASIVLVRTLMPAVISLGLPDWATTILVLPLILVMVFALVVWLLVCEPAWMWLGAYRLLGIRRHLIRESLRNWSAPKT